MRAIVQREYGSANVFQIEEIDRPTIRDDEVLVRVRAAGGSTEARGTLWRACHTCCA